MWRTSAKRYVEDYRLSKANDLVLVGAILTQQLTMYRAQLDLADHKKASTAQGIIIKAATEIRELEKALGIDKKTREAGGQHTVADYIARLKRAGHEKGVRLSEELKEMQAFCNEMRWQIRLLRNGDVEDKSYHSITPDSIIDRAEQLLAEIEEKDKKWAKNKHRIFVGQL